MSNDASFGLAEVHPLPTPATVLPGPLTGNHESMDILKFLSLLQQLNPTRSALMQQIQQLVTYIEHDKRLTNDEKNVLLNDDLRETIKKLKEDYDNRARYNRPNCPLRRDLTFYYANLYVKYHEVSLMKMTHPGPVFESTGTIIPEAVPINTIGDGNTFGDVAPPFPRTTQTNRRTSLFPLVWRSNAARTTNNNNNNNNTVNDNNRIDINPVPATATHAHPTTLTSRLEALRLQRRNKPPPASPAPGVIFGLIVIVFLFYRWLF
jgi:hypothetical protein